MGLGSRSTVALVCTLAYFSSPAALLAATPPNRSDPCAIAGRDTCGTAGVGFYKASRFGMRWFGDYRGAVPGRTHVFCIDLRFWYASPTYRYRDAGSAVLRNRDGVAVTLENQQKMSYAIWEYGHTATPSQQAAVMLYVHSLMGDARRGELAPTALGARILSHYKRIASTAARFHGPYRIDARFPDALAVGQLATVSIRLVSASGQALPDAKLTLAARGASGLAQQVQTDAAGLVEVALKPTASDLRLRITSAPLASSRPRIFVPTSAAAAANGQRLAAPSSQQVSVTIVKRASPLLAAAVSRQIVRPGSRIFDRIQVHGLGSTPARIEVELFGPSASRANLSCTGRPYWKGQIPISGEGEVHSPGVNVVKAGFYTYRERLVGPSPGRNSSSGCALAAETALAVPRIVAGRGDVADAVRAPGATGAAPVRVRLPSVRIDAPVAAVAIDVNNGVLGIPASIRRTGWWRDGAAPGARSGAVLIAGHVDSGRGGTGAFFRLHLTRVGDRVQVTAADGRTYTYRVVSVRDYRKSSLPISAYSSSGPARLVLVTCGGPFDSAAGHYRDNVVLTAVPA